MQVVDKSSICQNFEHSLFLSLTWLLLNLLKLVCLPIFNQVYFKKSKFDSGSSNLAN